MKYILILISIMILGLYSCEKESTSAIEIGDLNGKWSRVSTKDSLTIIDSAFHLQINNKNIEFTIHDSIFHQTTFEITNENNFDFLIIKKFPFPVIKTKEDGSYIEILEDRKFEFKIINDSLLFLKWDYNFDGNFKEDPPEIYTRIK